jgi:ferredoxin
MTAGQAQVDSRVCVGTAMCRSIAPEAFVLDDTGRASFVPGAGASLADLIEAAENCPVQAIAVDEGGPE